MLVAFVISARQLALTPDVAVGVVYIHHRTVHIVIDIHDQLVLLIIAIRMPLYLRLLAALADGSDIAGAVIGILVYAPTLGPAARLVLGDSVGRIAAVCLILDSGGQYQTAVGSIELAVRAAVQPVIVIILAPNFSFYNQ